MGGRLVGQDQRRVMFQGPGDGHPLLLATGQVSRAVTEPLAEPDAV